MLLEAYKDIFCNNNVIEWIIYEDLETPNNKGHKGHKIARYKK